MKGADGTHVWREMIPTKTMSMNGRIDISTNGGNSCPDDTEVHREIIPTNGTRDIHAFDRGEKIANKWSEMIYLGKKGDDTHV